MILKAKNEPHFKNIIAISKNYLSLNLANWWREGTNLTTILLHKRGLLRLFS